MRPLALTLCIIGIAGPVTAQETRFSREMPQGSKLELMNINGSMTIVSSNSRTLEVVVTKTVKKGTGAKVKAILEEGSGYVRVCTLDQASQPSRVTCKGSREEASTKEGWDQVEMKYTVRVPPGVTVVATNVNGSISATGVGRAEGLETVNGDVIFKGESAGRLNSVNGSITAEVTSTSWTGALKLGSVNGSVEVTLPAKIEATIKGETVNGSVSSDFKSLTVNSKYGPQHSLSGMLGKGGRSVELATVSGSVAVKVK